MAHATVIVPARDAGRTLPRTLDRIQSQVTSFEFDVVVVDDGSGDRTPAVAAAAGGNVRLLVQDGSGPAAARNRGVAESSGSVLAFCDADCYPADGWLEAGVNAAEHAGLVQGKVLPDPEKRMGPFDRSLWITHEVGLWETANLFVTRKLFEQVGGFEEWLTPVAGKAMAEDVWFGWRVKRTGAPSEFCEHALVYHEVFQRSVAGYVHERRRCQHFPEMAAKIPELRNAFLYRRWFLNRRTAAFDVAAAAAVTAKALRRPWPLAAALPFAGLLAARARPWAGMRAEVMAVDLAADLVTAWALIRGSLKARSLVL